MQDALIAERLERILVDQREPGGDEALEFELRTFLAERPSTSDQNRRLHVHRPLLSHKGG